MKATYNIGAKVSFKFSNLFTGKEETHKGTIRCILGELVCIADETINLAVYVNRTAIYGA